MEGRHTDIFKRYPFAWKTVVNRNLVLLGYAKYMTTLQYTFLADTLKIHSHAYGAKVKYIVVQLQYQT